MLAAGSLVSGQYNLLNYTGFSTKASRQAMFFGCETKEGHVMWIHMYASRNYGKQCGCKNNIALYRTLYLRNRQIRARAAASWCPSLSICGDGKNSVHWAENRQSCCHSKMVILYTCYTNALVRLLHLLARRDNSTLNHQNTQYLMVVVSSFFSNLSLAKRWAYWFGGIPKAPTILGCEGSKSWRGCVVSSQ